MLKGQYHEIVVIRPILILFALTEFLKIAYTR
jgi:hypothetical protein